MNVLVLGGTHFIGPHLVAALQKGGHEVTTFNRGITTDTLSGVERLKGDRVASDLAALEGRSFDATIDMCGYFPRVIDEVFAALAEPGFYAYISSASVYASFADHDQDETAPLAQIDDESSEEVTGESYGALKALCEVAVQRATDNYAILRLGLVVGPGDSTDRLTYWIARTAAGGRILAPNSREDAMQWIDARDIADFAVRLVENQTRGVFNVIRAAGTTTVGMVLDAAEQASGSSPEYVWLAADRIEEFDVAPWVDFPAWLPPQGDSAGFASFNTQAAHDAGLRSRSVADTVRDIHAWFVAQDRPLKTGLSRERETEILDALTSE